MIPIELKENTKILLEKNIVRAYYFIHILSCLNKAMRFMLIYSKNYE